MRPLGPLGADRATDLVARFPDATILVVGDVMLDEFVIGRVNRISPEAPVPIVEFEHEDYRLGGAANVAHNVKTLGGSAELFGLIGEDAAGDRFLQELVRIGMRPDGVVIDRTRRTTRKMRIVTERNQQVARVDYETGADPLPAVEEALAERLAAVVTRANAVVVSDYLKGTITKRLMARLTECARQRGIPLLVDPKIPHLAYYGGTTLVTPNHHEAEIATHMRIRTDEDVRIAARAFRERAGCDAVLITRGDQGMWLLDGAIEGHLPATAREVADVTGAGDTVVATLAVSLAVGADLTEAALLANQAAGVAVGKFGPAAITRDELLETITAAESSTRRTEPSFGPSSG